MKGECLCSRCTIIVTSNFTNITIVHSPYHYNIIKTCSSYDFKPLLAPAFTRQCRLHLLGGCLWQGAAVALGATAAAPGTASLHRSDGGDFR